MHVGRHSTHTTSKVFFPVSLFFFCIQNSANCLISKVSPNMLMLIWKIDSCKQNSFACESIGLDFSVAFAIFVRFHFFFKIFRIVSTSLYATFTWIEWLISKIQLLWLKVLWKNRHKDHRIEISCIAWVFVLFSMSFVWGNFILCTMRFESFIFSVSL